MLKVENFSCPRVSWSKADLSHLPAWTSASYILFIALELPGKLVRTTGRKLDVFQRL